MNVRHVDLPLTDYVSQTYGPAKAVSAVFDSGAELQFVDGKPKPGDWTLANGGVKLGAIPSGPVTALAADPHLAPRVLDASEVADCVASERLDLLNGLAAA
ncbi:hypothetical protein [Oceanibaculum indicum]|uniref:Uncharacterized protein n=1 Tax=Oceanibaculum indicum TaxID=526216 RepID=A0A420WGJ9_9PROT|nr:hypothetical protein [Oceanibaculum indicum]RKQ70107.1 hypothetical protein BCL74_2046 [Oceanibaculum indicum]